jgi:23S rRNA (cytidine1920-2'-O)/16S rRNA (cytidine1409-2'-O)-methyltransferase
MSRLDLELFSRGLFKSREKSKCAIEDGLVFVDGVKVTKPSFEVVSPNSIIKVLDNQVQYVGRGGLKLEGALKHFNIEVSGFNVLVKFRFSN